MTWAGRNTDLRQHHGGLQSCLCLRLPVRRTASWTDSGVKRGLPLAAFVWSVFAALHGLVRSVTSFTSPALGLGLAEGGNFPAAIKTVGEWFPVKERALATGIFNSASNIGAIVCPLTIPLIAAAFRLADGVLRHRRAGPDLDRPVGGDVSAAGDAPPAFVGGARLHRGGAGAVTRRRRRGRRG